MKTNLNLRLLLALLVTVALPAAMANTFTGTFFSDNFTGASTINSASPVIPTANSTSYEEATSKTNYPAVCPYISSHIMRICINTNGGGAAEIQALFMTNAVTLAQAGDYIRLTVTFTNTSGLMTAGVNTYLGFGLYNSSQVLPYPGGMNANLLSLSNDVVNGYAQGWEGYWAQVAGPSASGTPTRIMTRAPQTATDNRNQDLATAGSSQISYKTPVGAILSGSSIAGTPVLTEGSVYTDVLTISYVGIGSLGVTNAFYSGPDTSGTLLTQNGGAVTGDNFLTGGFDAFAVSFYNKTTGTSNTMDISSIQVSGQADLSLTPPLITAQPVSATVATNGACDFWVSAAGVSLNYRWYRNGTALSDGGNISGATTPVLAISSAGLADQFSVGNGYYCVITNTAGITNSVTNSLSLMQATNLIWASSGGGWDVNSTADWKDPGGNLTTFNYGDAVTFNDSASTKIVNLNGLYMTAASVTVSNSAAYTFQGSGSFSGPGKLIDIGSGQLTIDNANTYSGGTIISNSSINAPLYLNNWNGLGTGPVTLAKGAMEITTVGSGSLGIRGDINVTGDFTNQFDGVGNYSGVYFGNLSGTSGKTLTLQPDYNDLGNTTNRFRVYGTNTVCNANLNLVGTVTSQANYNGTCLAPYNSSGSQTYNGVISGNGGLIQRDSGITILNGQNTYVGGTWPTTGIIGFGANTVGTVTSGPIGTGPLFLAPEIPNVTGSGQVMAWGVARTIANPIKYPSATNNLTLLIGGTNALTFTGTIALQGQDGNGTLTNRIFQVTNTALTTFSGVISDAAPGFGLTKSGNGILALSSTETYTEPTLVSNGTLWVNGALNVSSAVTVATNGILGGTGTVNGPVTVQPGGSIAAGAASIGTLTLASLNLMGNVNVRVNRSGSASDEANVSGTLNNAGTGYVIVNNTGAALQIGDTFHVFNKAVTGGASLIVGGGGVAWNNQLANNGTIIVSGLGLPPITPTVAGSSITLSWPAAYLGWEVQSNRVSLTSATDWYTVPNTGGSTSYGFTVNNARTNVFYRLVFP